MSLTTDQASKGVCEACHGLDRLSRVSVIGYRMWVCQACRRAIEQGHEDLEVTDREA